MIPKNVTYICRPEIEVGFRWDDSSEEKLERSIKVIPTFCSDSENEKTLETGRKWAEGYCNKHNAKEFTFKNTIIKDVKLVSLEVRSEGGRAWKIIVPGRYYFDLREDVLLDILLNSMVKDGRINCGLIWAKIGSQMKLVRYCSGLFQKAVDAGERKESKDIKNPDIGGIYENRKGEQFLYLGKVKTKKLIEKQDPLYSYYRPRPFIKEILDISGQLWLKIPGWKKELNLLDNYGYGKETYYFLNGFSEVTKSKIVINKVKQTEYTLETFRNLNKEAIQINEATLI